MAGEAIARTKYVYIGATDWAEVTSKVVAIGLGVFNLLLVLLLVAQWFSQRLGDTLYVIGQVWLLFGPAFYLLALPTTLVLICIRRNWWTCACVILLSFPWLLLMAMSLLHIPVLDS